MIGGSLLATGRASSRRARASHASGPALAYADDVKLEMSARSNLQAPRHVSPINNQSDPELRLKTASRPRFSSSASTRVSWLAARR